MPRTNRVPELSDAEEAEVQAGIEADPENPEWTVEDFKQVRPFAEVFPELAASWRRTRGPQKAPTKKLVSLRLSPEVLEHFKAGGPGWQSRINDTLIAAVRRERRKARRSA